MNYALTPIGVAQMMADLYTLPSAELLAKATAIKADFKKFVSDNFTLSAEQKIYLRALNDQVSQYFGDQCWFCFLYKLKISLVYPDPPTAAYAKYVEEKSTVKPKAGLAGDPQVTGELIFTIVYEVA